MTIRPPVIAAKTGRTLKWERLVTARRIKGIQSLIYQLAAPALRNRNMVPIAARQLGLSNGPLAGAYTLETAGGAGCPPFSTEIADPSQ
jgi:hypothetical protein